MRIKARAVTGVTRSSGSHTLECSLLCDPVPVKFKNTAQTCCGGGRQNGGFWVALFAGPGCGAAKC